MSDMKFFAGLSKPVEMTTRKIEIARGGEVLVGDLHLRVELNGNTVRSTPIFVRDVYDGMKKATSRSKQDKIDTSIENQSVEIYSTPDSPGTILLIPYTTVEKMVVNRDKDGKVYLDFVITKIGIDKSNIWDLCESSGRTIYTKFSSTAPPLIEEEEEEAPAKPARKKKVSKHVN